MTLQTLLDHENTWPTRMGKAFLCERVVMRGKDLHHELGSWDWFKMYCFSITGREFTDNQLKLLNWIWLATSYPDPSIWPNHVAALVGTARSTSSMALVAGLAVWIVIRLTRSLSFGSSLLSASVSSATSMRKSGRRKRFTAMAARWRAWMNAFPIP